MRVNIRPQVDGTYSARFTGRFFKVIPFSYRVDLVPTGYDASSLVARKRLGPVLGSYAMQASFGSQYMNGSFQAGGDRGSISMKRVSRF